MKVDNMVCLEVSTTCNQNDIMETSGTICAHSLSICIFAAVC